MWSDNDIDNAFQRLNPPEVEPAPFPLDAWLRLETQLDKEEVARTVRRKMWKFFAAELLVVGLVALSWFLWWPASPAAPAASLAPATAGESSAVSQPVSAANAAVSEAGPQHTSASAGKTSAIEPTTATVATTAATPASPEPAAATTRPAAAPAHSTAIIYRKNGPALVAVTPNSKSDPKRRQSVERRTSRMAVAGTFTASVSRNTGRSMKEGQAYLARRADASSATSPRVASAASTLATPVTERAALVTTGRSHRTTSLQQLHDAQASSEPVATAAVIAAPAAASTAAGGSAAADNSDLSLKPVALAAATTAALPAPLGAVAETPLAALLPEPRFFVGVVGAPDVSTVKFAGVERPLLNLGLTLEYRFTNRLRVTTGLLRADKDYYARREDYDWTNYPKAQTRDFSWVEGKCTVLDVPLNIRYDAVVQANARWFGSAGLSSFFMHRENYSYDYLEGGTYKMWDMPGLVNANQHLLSVLNLSAGYERSLSNHWRLQAEPYVKVPLGGVGAGKVKLTSAGVFLGVKYGF